MLGGGGFRTPLVFRALLEHPVVDEVVLYDPDAERLTGINLVLAAMAAAAPERAPSVRLTTELDDALAGAQFVFSAIRVGGLAGRVADERVALDLGLLGQETTGPGGLAFGLRTVPEAIRIAERVRAVAPRAWVVNFTNPAGMITEAMRTVLGERVIGICDSPIALARRITAAVGVADLSCLGGSAARLDYAGLNHLGWLREIRCGDRELVAEFLADDDAINAVEEGALFGAPWLRALGMVPNEYLYYWYFTRDAIASISTAPQTRGEQLLQQQQGFYAGLSGRGDPAAALAAWATVHHERNATYLQEARSAERSDDDIAAGGYEGVAVALMRSLAGGGASMHILNVANAGLPGLDADAVVEVPCRVDANGPAPQPVSPLTGHALGLVQQVKEVERLVIEAAVTGSPDVAVTAFALHPLVDSVTVARQLLAGYRTAVPAVDAVFSRQPSGLVVP